MGWSTNPATLMLTPSPSCKPVHAERGRSMTDGVNISLETIYGQQQEMMRTLTGIPQMVADHEARLRVQEKREDLAHRVTVLENSSAQVMASVEKQGERIGKMEQDVAAIRADIATFRPVRVHWTAIAAVVASGAIGTAALIVQLLT